MPADNAAAEREARFIDRMLVDLRADEAKDFDPPIKKRRLSPAALACCRRRSATTR